MPEEAIRGLSMGSYAAHGPVRFTDSGSKYNHHRDQGFGMINDWEEEAACRDTDLNLWFGEERPFGDKRSIRTKEQTDQAKAICARCPVLDDCRRWVMEVKLPYGLVAGMTEAERQRLIDQGEAAWREFWKQQDQEFGQNNHNGNKTHCRNGHPYSPENTYTSTTGSRFCKACWNILSKQYQQRKREELGHYPWQQQPQENGHNAG